VEDALKQLPSAQRKALPSSFEKLDNTEKLDWLKLIQGQPGSPPPPPGKPQAEGKFINPLTETDPVKRQQAISKLSAVERAKLWKDAISGGLKT
jgi:hypothetical protein